MKIILLIISIIFLISGAYIADTYKLMWTGITIAFIGFILLVNFPLLVDILSEDKK